MISSGFEPVTFWHVTCSDRELVYSAKAKIFSNMLYVEYVHLTKGQTYSISGLEPQGAWHQDELIGSKLPEFTEFFWTFSIILYSKKHDVSETGSVSVLR
jgi:hypothetical protein